MASPPFDPNQAIPGDTDVVSQHPAGARTFRDVMESWMLINHDTNGDHFQVNLPEGADPSAISNKGILYSKDVATITELFYRDSAGTILQITAAGSIASSLVSGTKMLFQQTTAPTGWTKDTTHNDKALRVVTGTVGSGGASAFSSVFGSSKLTGSHTLVIAEIPAHKHTVGENGIWHFNDPASDGNINSGSQGRVAANVDTSTVGGGSGHTHTLSLDLQFVDLIIATKD